MRTKISLISGPRDWILCGVIILVAIIGKFGGTLIAARFSGHSMKSSVGLGILMNTRGLVELIALNIGLDIGVISPRLFAMMVIMALVTTLMTGPALKLVKGFEQE
jgi:Kef-type K+ transport system membrane component KefB